MLNFGIIGDVRSLEKYIGFIRQNRDTQIVGKSSIGVPAQDDKLKFTIPEFNRVELIDRADALIINNFSLFPFSFLCDMVKKSKHIFATEYPELTQEECSHLVKLTQEANTVFQIINPLNYSPPIDWVKNAIRFPALLKISYSKEKLDVKTDLIWLLLTLNGIVSDKPKKLFITAFNNEITNTNFKNLHLLFGDATRIDINFGEDTTKNEFTLELYCDNQFIKFNLTEKQYAVNNQKIKFKSVADDNELSIFIDSVTGKTEKKTQIEDYYSVLSTIEKINKKLEQFS
jgi:hypothetical protein